MPTQLGRIKGPALYADLTRSGVDVKFSNELNTNVVLYVDVSNNRIGINIPRPSTPFTDLFVPATIKTDSMIAGSTAQISNFELSSETFNLPTNGDLILNSPTAINLSSFATDGLLVKDNYIFAKNLNANINLVPAGSGIVEIQGNALIQGNVHATGNITAAGNLVFGNENTDTVTLGGQVTTSLIPAQASTYNIGSPTDRFAEIFSPLLNGQGISAGSIILPNFQVVLDTPIDNIFFVAQNGDDTNLGNHPQNPFRTIKAALDASDSSISGPAAVYVFPGTYEEEFPLTVPNNCALIGTDIRNCIIKPAAGYESENAFLLNGETLVQNLTIKDFYYDAVNNKGYAFSFANNATITARSPYIQNCTVITKGSVVTSLDPKGFDQGDAGKGALVDGESVLSTSREASMLFNSCTFITPGVDSLTALNGTRIEWLNCFTYFANRGIYAYNGNVGHLSSDGSTMQYGAEIRSIGSACVYGNKGIEGDGASVLIYAINHNLAYIGAGKHADNDPTRVIFTNKIVKQNNAKIYYQSQDHTGNFSVGDSFYVNLEDGTTSISNASFEQVASIEIVNANDPTEKTDIFPSEISVGDFLISGNSIQTSTQTFNIQATNDVNTENLNIDNNFVINSDLILHGNFQITGNLSFNATLISDVISTEGLALSNTVSIGFTNQGYGRSVDISESYFIVGSPTASVGTSGGAGRAYLYDTSNNVIDILNPVYTGGTTGSSDNFGLNVAMNTNYSIVGAQFARDVNNSSIRTGAAYIFNNSDGSLHLTLVDQNPESDGRFGYAVDVNETYAIVGAWKQTAGVLAQSGRAYIYEISTGNFVRSHDGTGYNTYFGQAVSISENYYIIGEPNKFSQRGRAYLYAIDGTLIATLSSPNAQQFGLFGVSVAINESVAVVGAYNENTQGNVYVFDVTNGSLLHTIPNPNIEPTTTSQDGFGIEVAVTDNFIIAGTLYEDANATDSGTVYIFDISTGNLVDSISGTSANQQFGSGIGATSNKIIIGANGEARARVYEVGGKNLGSPSLRWKSSNVNNLKMPVTSFIDNVIETTSNNLEITAAGTGIILLDTNNLEINNGLTVNLNSNLSNLNINGNISITGNINQTGDINATNFFTDSIYVGQAVQFDEIQVIDNIIQSTNTNADTEFRAAGSGKVIIDNDVNITQNLYLGGALNTTTLTIQNATTSPKWISSDIVIEDNFIETTNSNSNLEIRVLEGKVSLLYSDLFIDNNLYVNNLLNLQNTTTKNVTISTSTQLTGNFNQSGEFSTSTLTSDNNFLLENLNVVNTSISTTLSNSNLDLVANGTGNLQFDNLHITNNLNITDLLYSNTNDFGTINSPYIETENIKIFNNNIETTLSNSDLELRSTSRKITIESIQTDQFTIKSLTNDITFTAPFIDMSTASHGLTLAKGSFAERNSQAGIIRFNTQSNLFEGATNTKYESFRGLYNADTTTSVIAHPTNDTLLFTINSVNVGTFNNQHLEIPGLEIDNQITVNNSTIETIDSNANLELRIGSGQNINLNNSFFINDNEIIQLNSQSTVIAATGFGYTKIQGTGGTRIPSGTSTQRFVSTTGQLRYNTQISNLELFEGTGWIDPLGGTASTPISEEEMTDQGFFNSLIFG